MVDYLAHWATLCKCSSCGKIPETTPLYHCKFQHQYCLNCFEKLQRKFSGDSNECICLVCKNYSVFHKSTIDDEFLKIINTKPSVALPTKFISASTAKIKPETTLQKLPSKCTVEHLFKINHKNNTHNNNNPSTSNCNEIIRKFESLSLIKSTTNVSSQMSTSSTVTCSKKPLLCPHDFCQRVITLSSFATHFKYEHQDVPRYTLKRGSDLTLPFNASMLRHSWSYCLAIITVYDVNQIKTENARSPKSVQKTCSKLSQKVPVNTFWLMVDGSPKERKSYTYALVWLLSDSDDLFKCIIELSSKFESKSFSTYCSINGLRDFDNINDIFEIAQKLNCLLLPRSSLISLLHEGPDLNLRVSIH